MRKKQPSLWSAFANITPRQLEQYKALKRELNASQIKHENIQTAFTFGKKLNQDEVSRIDYRKQFDHIYEALKSTGKFNR